MQIPKIFKKKIVLIPLIVFGVGLLAIYPTYLLGRVLFNSYFAREGEKLLELEKAGLLSKEFGAAWQDVLASEAMARGADSLMKQQDESQTGFQSVNGIIVQDYPSLSIVARLNEVRAYSNSIRITDRKDREIALIQTDHTRAKIHQFPEVLIKALVAAEDKNFFNNPLGFEYDSFVRAFIRSRIKAILTFKNAHPRGTSTITQQVAKLFISQLDESGQRHVSVSVKRKVRELRLSAALRKKYTADEIFEVYLNHCVASDYGLIGIKDIALGFFNKELDELSDPECVYLARMVKWGSNIHAKIARQCRIDMPRMAKVLGWTEDYQNRVLTAIDNLKFRKPKQIQTKSGHLVDLANEFWLKYINKGKNPQSSYNKDMDIINPNSLIRKKGNLTIKLTIDLPLQKYLEKLVNARGYGQDTIIYTDVRIGSKGENITRNRHPRDTLRQITVVDTATRFSEPHSEYFYTLVKGDTLVKNIRYQRLNPGKKIYRRSVYYYTRKLMKVDGQYYTYCIIDSHSGKLLAYYSKDKIGSRLACLLKNRVPNGSSTAKPIVNALNFDLGVFPPYAKWTDMNPVTADVPWKRIMLRRKDKPYEVVFANSSVRGKGYRVHNHDYIFEGCNYIFDHLATSNNIFGVESIYRLNRVIFSSDGRVVSDAFNFAQFLYRLNAFEAIKNELKTETVTGVRLYKELSRIVGVNVDTMVAYGRKVGVSDSLYSISLGTLEMTLYEQVHLFNMLYNNDLIERPIDHPSLIIEQIDLNGTSIVLDTLDVIKRYHPFADIQNIRPTHLGMHKRLVSNRWDGLNDYDLSYDLDSSGIMIEDTVFNSHTLVTNGPLSNYAKSGTTDDILRPFNVDVTSKKRTNYGLWNAIIRVNLEKLDNDTLTDIRDITIACIGECNRHYTGMRDGKTLHKFVSKEILKKAGKKNPHGYFNLYENYLKKVTPDSLRRCEEFARDSLSRI